MKRRTFALLAGSSLAALKVGAPAARAARVDASLLTTTLTPMGSERAGNADGSIPAWTGGLTTLPAGLKPGDYVPELFPDEQPIAVVDAGNMAQHADRLSDGIMAMMTKYGLKIKVYPCHRTAASPQYVYDNIAKNATTATFSARDPVGGRWGFENAYGGIPFPIPDVSAPLTAGAQIMWNNNTLWHGFCLTELVEAWSVNSGSKTMASQAFNSLKYFYYDPHGSLAHFNDWLLGSAFRYTAPPMLVGQEITGWASTSPGTRLAETWELLNGQGRVRRAPEISFDTPSSSANGTADYDEYYGFNGSLERYDWKYLGKKEMYIPYNNNALYAGPAEPAHLDHFFDPDLVRWELHRCWVVEATLHPGERNVLARRRFYHDEDTWGIAVADAWDGNDNLFKVNIIYNNCRPDLPGTIIGNNTIHNLQTGDWASIIGPWNQAKTPTLKFVSDLPDTLYQPNTMAAAAQY